MYEELDVVDPEVAFSRSLAGKECQLCNRILNYKFFSKDSSSRDGYSSICPKCKATPRLSTAENLHRQREANFSSAAVDKQRRPDEECYMERDSKGRVLYSHVFIDKLKSTGIDIIVGPAAFAEELSLYVHDHRYPNSARYVGWIPAGPIQEFSEYKYNNYLVPTDETAHGYRGILRNLIFSGYLTEDKCNEVFGHCDETIWAKSMWFRRNKI